MSEIGIVFTTELARKLRSRIFWFATLGGALGIAFLLEAPVFLNGIARSSTSDIVLAGPRPLRAHAAKLLEARNDFHVVASVEHVPLPVTIAYLDAHGKAGAVVALSVRGARLRVDVYPRDISTFDGVEFRDLSPLNVELATATDPARVESALAIERHVHPLDAKFADPRSAAIAHGVAFGLTFVLYLAIIIASQSVMSSVAEEKTSRIAEILVATIEPSNLLAGKTLAAAVVALVQIGLWIATAAVLLPQAALSLSGSSAVVAAAPGAATGPNPLTLDPAVLGSFVLFFVLGYFQFASVYAAAASLISRTEDLASVATPVILPVVAAFVIAQFALVQPHAAFVVVASFVPFVSPFVMFTRLAVSSVPSWQIGLAILINSATVVVCFWIAGKIYRVGMLMYGKLPTPKQLVAALRA